MSETQTRTQPAPFAQRPHYTEVYPLDDFYAARGLTLPVFARVEPEQIPEPARQLLVHDKDMTSRLEAYHKRKIHIRVAARLTRGQEYFREVALELDGTLEPVEFGAIKINLDLFPVEAREEILSETRPLGRILHHCHIEFSSRPSAYFRLASDDFIGGVLHLTGAHLLFARRNTLLDTWERPLAEIVEILPPSGRAAEGAGAGSSPSQTPLIQA
jgi:chorismate-pyruvate lyase